MNKCYYDQNDLNCQEVAKSVQETPTVKNLENWFEKGHLYVYDAPFLREICSLGDHVAWNLFEACPYERFCQFDYVASLAVDRYIQEAKSGLHDNTNIDATTQIVSFAVSLSPNSSIEVESETRDILLQSLGKDLFNKLFYKECETQDFHFRFLNELTPDQVFYRPYGENIKLARLFPVPEDSPKAFLNYRIKFDEVSSELEELVIIPWTATEIAQDDLDCVWSVLEEPYLNYFLNNEKPPVIEDELLDVVDSEEENQELYIPKNFEEAVDYLVAQSVPCNEPGWHFMGGMSLRNGWGLWHNKTPIAKWFTENGLYHGDDRSGILSEAVDAKLKGKKFDVYDRIKYYQEWWPKQYGEKCFLENMKRNFFENNK